MGIKYNNLEQRVIGMYIDTFPSFVPDENAPVTIESQRYFFNFMKDLSKAIYVNPHIMFSVLHEDDFFTRRFNRAYDNKPKLYQEMKKILKKTEDYLRLLMELGKEGTAAKDKLIVSTIKISKRHLEQLKAFSFIISEESNGISLSNDTYNGMYFAWKWMAERENTTLLKFSRCMFLEGYPYIKDCFSAISGDINAFNKLTDFLEANGYTRLESRNGMLTLDYYKEYDSKPSPIKDVWAERTHSGIGLKYDFYVEQPLYIGVRVPRFREILEDIGSADNELKEFVIENNRKCDGCRYCVQTDKTGKRPFSYVTVEHNEVYNVCPIFQGFYCNWTSLNNELVDNIIKYLKFIDRIMCKQTTNNK